MRFTVPSALAWLLLLAVPIILYLLRLRPRTVRVSTLNFFQSLARVRAESPWMRRLKRLLSFLLTVLVVLCGVGALTRPVVAPPTGEMNSVVILLDRSASMGARDARGRSRLQDAVARARERLAGLPGGVGVTIMAYDRRPEIVLPRTVDRRAVDRALRTLQVTPIEGDAERALSLARRLAALDPPAGIWHLTDAPPPADSSGENASDAPQDEVEVVHLGVALPSPVNAGITAFQLRRLPLATGEFEAFIQIHGVSPEPLEAELEIRIDGKLTAIRNITISTGGRERLLTPLRAGDGEILSVKITVEGDSLPTDDEIHARLPRLRPVRVLWIAPSRNTFTELALVCLGQQDDIEVYEARPSAWPVEEPVDVIVFHKWLPEQWPDKPSVILIDPPGALGPVRAVRIEAEGGLPLDRVRTTERRHPLLYGVASARVALTQTLVLDATGPLEPLWVGSSGPVMLAGDAHGQRIVVMGFDPERSERLPLMASFPLLMANAVYWSARPLLESEPGAAYATGDLVALKGKTITWTTPNSERQRDSSVPIEGLWTELDRVGLWTTEEGESGSAMLLSPQETRLPQAPAQRTVAGDGEVSGVWGRLSGQWARPLMWAVLVVLVLESWLFHRHGVH